MKNRPKYTHKVPMGPTLDQTKDSPKIANNIPRYRKIYAIHNKIRQTCIAIKLLLL